MKDRIAKASAEAERRYLGNNGLRSGDDMASIDAFVRGWLAAHANPKRMKVSASDFDRVVAMRPYSLLAALDQLGIEVEDNE